MPIVRLLSEGFISRPNVVARVVIPINVAPNNKALMTKLVFDIQKAGIAIPKDCRAIASTKDLMNPHFLASNHQMRQDGIAAKPTIIQTKVAPL